MAGSGREISCPFSVDAMGEDAATRPYPTSKVSEDPPMTKAPDGPRDATSYIRKHLGQDLKNARKHGGFSVTALAEALSVTPAFVRAVERGEAACDVWYVRRVNKKCGLPEDFRTR